MSQSTHLSCGCQITYEEDESESKAEYCIFHSRGDSTLQVSEDEDTLKSQSKDRKKESWASRLFFAKNFSVKHAIWISIVVAIALLVINDVGVDASVP